MSLAVLAIIATTLLGGVLYVLNQYVVIVPRATVHASPTPAAAKQPVVQVTPPPEPSATPEPEPAIDLVDLQSRMQEWPQEVTLIQDTTFPGSVIAPAGTKVKLLSAGPEVEVDYNGEQAKLLADQTDLEIRVRSHRLQISMEEENRRKLVETRAARAQAEVDSRVRDVERHYGKPPTHNDAYFAVKTYLKETLKDPDTIEVISVSQPYIADYKGGKCWAVKIQFRGKDEVGIIGVQKGVAYINSDKVTDYIKD